MSILAKLASLFVIAPVVERLPQERKLDHTTRNYLQAMQGVERHGFKMAQDIQNDPLRAARVERREASRTAMEALVRESNEQKDKSVARVEGIARSMRD